MKTTFPVYRLEARVVVATIARCLYLTKPASHVVADAVCFQNLTPVPDSRSGRGEFAMPESTEPPSSPEFVSCAGLTLSICLFGGRERFPIINPCPSAWILCPKNTPYDGYRPDSCRVERRRVAGRVWWLIRCFLRFPWARFLPPLSEPAGRFPAPSSPVESCGSHTGSRSRPTGGSREPWHLARAPLRRLAGVSLALTGDRSGRPLLVHVMTSGIPAHLRGTRPSATPASLLSFAIAST